MNVALWTLVSVVVIEAALVVALVLVVVKNTTVDSGGRDRLIRALVARDPLHYDLLTRSAAIEKVAENPRPVEEREPRPMPHGVDGTI